MSTAALLDLLEPGWRSDLSAGTRAAELTVEPDVLRATARALGDQARARPPSEVARRWPACVVVALALAASGEGASSKGDCWPAWHRAAGRRATRRSSQDWGRAFLGALELLGIDTPDTARDAVLAQASPPPPSTAGTVAQETTAEGPGHARPRLDPFGLGVCVDGRPALPGEVTDPGDPLLAFDDNGDPIGPELPAAPVWVLHPADATLRSDVPPRVMLTSRPPLTWRGWRLLQIDLRGASWLELTGASRHPVRGRTTPVLVTGPPVPGVTTPTGERVLAELPDVLLPPGPGRWRVEARRAGTRTVLCVLTATGDGWRRDLLWRRVPRPVLGELTITVTGADGERRPGMRRTVTVAEGLTATYFPVPRLTSGDALEPAEAVLSAAPGMTVVPQAVPLPADAVTAEVRCVAGQVVRRLRVSPPHIRIRIQPEPGSGGTPTPWHHEGILSLRADELWRGGSLSIDLPGADRDPPVEVVGPDNEVVQVLEPTKQGRYPLRRAADTVTSCGGASLRITLGARTATIARIITSGAADDPWVDAFP